MDFINKEEEDESLKKAVDLVMTISSYNDVYLYLEGMKEHERCMERIEYCNRFKTMLKSKFELN